MLTNLALSANAIIMEHERSSARSKKALALTLKYLPGFVALEPLRAADGSRFGFGYSSLVPDSMRYKSVFVLRIKARPATAAEAMNPLGRELVASASNEFPGLSTKVLPC